MLIGYAAQVCRICERLTQHEIHESHGFLIKLCIPCKQRRILEELNRE